MPILAPSDRPEWPPLLLLVVEPVVDPVVGISVAPVMGIVAVRRKSSPGMEMAAPVAAATLAAARELAFRYPK
jgi:hypothetical protein